MREAAQAIPEHELRQWGPDREAALQKLRYHPHMLALLDDANARTWRTAMGQAAQCSPPWTHMLHRCTQRQVSRLHEQVCALMMSDHCSQCWQ
jgi:hypothetical protein